MIKTALEIKNNVIADIKAQDEAGENYFLGQVKALDSASTIPAIFRDERLPAVVVAYAGTTPNRTVNELSLVHRFDFFVVVSENYEENMYNDDEDIDNNTVYELSWALYNYVVRDDDIRRPKFYSDDITYTEYNGHSAPDSIAIIQHEEDSGKLASYMMFSISYYQKLCDPIPKI